MAIVERVRSYPIPVAARAAILAEIEAIYRAEKLGALLAQLPTEAGTAYNIRQ